MRSRLLLIFILLLTGNVAFSQTQPESAQKLLDQAYKQAAKEKKNVFVIFHASWCGWCKKMDASINDPACSDFFKKNYIFVHLVIHESKDKINLENPGAAELFDKYAGANSGIPFFLIYDQKGTLLADSKIRPAGAEPDKPAQNMGCPASDDEVAAFIEVLKKTSRISEAEITVISDRFRKNRS
jgi:thiol-disulfide isomerase/thioredoxin